MLETNDAAAGGHGDTECRVVAARVVQGHRVASGENGDSRYPGGTIRMQMPFFRALGLDLSRFHAGTVNVDIAPCAYRVVAPRHTFRQVAWHPTAPAEDFSFVDVDVLGLEPEPVTGFIYYPHPETKPCHFQKASVLELLLPFTPCLRYGMRVQLRIPVRQMAIDMRARAFKRSLLRVIHARVRLARSSPRRRRRCRKRAEPRAKNLPPSLRKNFLQRSTRLATR